jgi:hypothetical protein
METAVKKLSRKTLPNGSALILTVVLTSLLAIIGVLFVMVSRVDKMATSSISENKELDLAVDTVVAKISQELVFDVPGVAGQEYYDYPDVNNTWLASFEPYIDGTDYKWLQISDVYNKLGPDLQLLAEVVPDYQDAADMDEGVVADADGDGVADSRWVIIPEISSGKGRPIFAAIRIVDNGAMLNANTAYKFDPTAPYFDVLEKDIDRTSQMLINLLALTDRPADPCDLPVQQDEMDLLEARANPVYFPDPNKNTLIEYARNIIWRYYEPNGPYTPFDISDELEFRNRFLLNHSDIETRLEEWGGNFKFNTLSTPVMSGGRMLDAWFGRISDYAGIDPNYAYRHITTTYNMDRIIDPAGRKMVNVNFANANQLYAAIREGLLADDPNYIGAIPLAAQLAVNIVDLRDHYDSDPNMEVTVLPVGLKTCFGFEAQPFISEIGIRISETFADISANNHFAIELSNPFDVDIPLGNFRLEIRDPNGTVVGTINLSGYALSDGSQFIITNNNSASATFGVTGMMSTGGGKEDPALVLATYESVEDSDPPEYILKDRYDVFLIRNTLAGDIYLDKQQTQDDWFVWDANNVNIPHFYARRDRDWNIVYQEVVSDSNNTLGSSNGLDGTRRNYNFYNFANADERFTSVGDIARAFIIGPSTDPNDMIGLQLYAEPRENVVRLDLQDPNNTDIFQYLTVIDPTEHVDANDYLGYLSYLNETRVKGRININTAPWFVIRQLPWMLPAVAQAVVAYRDTVHGAFENIADIMQVPAMDFYANDTNDLLTYPDLTYGDNAIDDFEERDVIFSRISNIVTVRSDVFSAYILVRVGADGPQKRVMAILDRSQVTSTGGKVRILALHTVPDPR